MRVLLDGGADPDWGAPTARDCLKMFKQEDKWGKHFEEAKGRGKGGDEFVGQKTQRPREGATAGP